MSTKTMYHLDPWRITRARGGDYGQVLELLSQVFPEKHFTISFFWDMNKTWVAKDEHGHIIGTSSARLKGKGRGELHWIAVRSDHRREGLAGELCRRAMAWMHDRGARWITVRQNPETPAGNALYTSLGFKDPINGHEAILIPVPTEHDAR